MRRWWLDVAGAYILQPHHQHLLQCACEAWDRKTEAAEILRAEGLVITTARGAVQPHPCVEIERSSRAAFMRSLRELDLDIELPSENWKPPPALRSNRRR